MYYYCEVSMFSLDCFSAILNQNNCKYRKKTIIPFPKSTNFILDYANFALCIHIGNVSWFLNTLYS